MIENLLMTDIFWEIYVKNEKCQEAITGFTLVLTDVPQIYIIKLSKQMKWGKSPIMN